MPAYCYKCNVCKHEFTVRHSMSFEDQHCVECDSKDVFKIPTILEKIRITSNKKVGSIVNKHIEETRQEVKQEKLKRKEL